ncbi:hypothetical protein V8C34DRAFT_318676 [Trichoderma compactum]
MEPHSTRTLPVTKLRAALKGSFALTPDSEGYEASLRRWSEAAEKRAAIVVQARSAEDVSTALLFAQAHGLEVAVLGGGHSTSRSSSTEGGLLIDLTQMRHVTVNPSAKTIKSQGGAIWEGVDLAAAQNGLATVGGTVNHTGVGGLTLGGGYAWLSGKYGLTIDNLVKAEIVLADGRIMTTFTFRGYEQKNPVWAGLLAFDTSALDKVINFANKLVETTEGQSAMVVGIGAPAPTHEDRILTVLFYDGNEEEAKAYYDASFNLSPVVDRTSEMTYKQVNSMLNASTDTWGPQRMVNKVAQTAMSFTNRGSHYNILFEWTRNMGRKVTNELIKTKNNEGAREYGNYDDVSSSSAQDIFGVNYERGLELKKMYDAKNIFAKGAGEFSF